MYRGAQQTSATVDGSNESSPSERADCGGQPPLQARSGREPPRALLVDDDPEQRRPREILLHKWGYRVASAECGTHALELAQSHRPSVAILDIEMPDMSGYQLAASLKSRLGHQCPRLFAISGSVENSEVRNRLFDRMFAKPFDARTLRYTLQATLPLQAGHP